MRKFLAFALCLSVLLPLAGCAKKTASEELGEEMRKMNKEAGKTAKEAKEAFNF